MEETEVLREGVLYGLGWGCQAETAARARTGKVSVSCFLHRLNWAGSRAGQWVWVVCACRQVPEQAVYVYSAQGWACAPLSRAASELTDPLPGRDHVLVLGSCRAGSTSH